MLFRRRPQTPAEAAAAAARDEAIERERLAEARARAVARAVAARQARERDEAAALDEAHARVVEDMRRTMEANNGCFWPGAFAGRGRDRSLLHRLRSAFEEIGAAWRRG